MTQSLRHPSRSREQGGITIVVVLMLLALLTVAALSMSRNSFREIVITGSLRHAAEAKNVADTGLEWTLYWMAPAGLTTRPAPTGAGAQAFVGTLSAMRLEQTQPGIWVDLSAAGKTDLVTTVGDYTYSTDIRTIYMGKCDVTLTSQTGVGPTAGTRIRPDVFSTRSLAKTAVKDGPTFHHTREVWAQVPIEQ